MEKWKAFLYWFLIDILLTGGLLASIFSVWGGLLAILLLVVLTLALLLGVVSGAFHFFHRNGKPRKINAWLYGGILMLIFCAGVAIVYLHPMVWWTALIFAVLVGVDVAFVAIFEPKEDQTF